MNDVTTTKPTNFLTEATAAWEELDTNFIGSAKRVLFGGAGAVVRTAEGICLTAAAVVETYDLAAEYANAQLPQSREEVREMWDDFLEDIEDEEESEEKS